MKSLFKITTLLIFVPMIALANSGPLNGKYTKEKTLKKEFTVNPDATLEVSNSYGNLEITTWDQNRTVIEVHIITNGNDEEKVQKKLDEIDVDFSGSPSLVRATTKFNNKKSSWSFFGNNSKVQMEINYTIKLPLTNSVDLKNDYGAITLNKLEGTATIHCDYGQLILGELLGENNNLEFDYTTKSTIGFMKSGKIDADYSGFTLEDAGEVLLNADYTTSKIMKVKSLKFSCDYGSIEINEAVDIIGNGDYLTNRIGSLSGNLDLDSDYGSITITELSGNSNNVTINADYTGVKLGYSSNYNFNFDIDLTYANLKGEEHLTIKTSIDEISSKKFEGFRGNENTKNFVTANIDYGSIAFKLKQ